MPDLGNTSVLSPTDGSNASGTMPSWNGSASPNTIDDAGRALQGAVAREWECRSFPASTGTAPSFVVTYTVAPAAIRSGQTYTMTAHAAAVGSDTVNINALGAKTIKKVVSGTKTSLSADDFFANDKLMLEYDGTDLVWVNWSGSSAASLTAASTTEMLTGTDTAKYLTADSAAALWEKGSDVASATTLTLGEGSYFHITGTTTITDIDFGTAKNGRTAILVFDGILTLTHNSTTLILPTGANITTAAGDTCCVVQDSGDNVKVTWYQRASGAALSSSGGMTTLGTLTTTSGASQTLSGLTLTDYKYLKLQLNDVSLVAGNNLSLGTANGDEVQITANLSAGTRAFRGYVEVWLTNGHAISVTAEDNTTTVVHRAVDTAITTASTAVYLETNGTFDAGSVTVYAI